MVYGIYCGFIIIHLHQIDIPKLDYNRIIFYIVSYFVEHLFSCLILAICVEQIRKCQCCISFLTKYDCIEIYRHMLKDTLPYLNPLCLELFHLVRYYLYSGEFSCSVYIPLVQSSLFPNQSAFLSQMEQAHGCCQATVWPSTLQGSHGNHPLCQFIQWL